MLLRNVGSNNPHGATFQKPAFFNEKAISARPKTELQQTFWSKQPQIQIIFYLLSAFLKKKYLIGVLHFH
jgi:hypothetical protein